MFEPLKVIGRTETGDASIIEVSNDQFTAMCRAAAHLDNTKVGDRVDWTAFYTLMEILARKQDKGFHTIGFTIKAHTTYEVEMCSKET